MADLGKKAESPDTQTALVYEVTIASDVVTPDGLSADQRRRSGAPEA
jgi:hypothetical protein